MVDQPEAVPPDGAAILSEARAFVSRFVAFPSPGALDLAVLWSAHTWCTGTDDKLLFDSTPRLAFLSDLPASGKSRALEVTCALSRKAALISDVTGPALHQLVAAGATLAVDELDLVLGGDSAKPVRGVINSGYRRSGQVARNKGLASTFAPCALAGLRSVFDRSPVLAATRSRAIEIEMSPNSGKVQLDRWRERLHLPAAAAIGAAMGGWAVANTVSLVTTYPAMPEDGCEDRLLDLWEPLFILAAVAGGDWPARCLAAFGELGASTSSSEPAVPPGMRLLADIKAVWPAGATRVSTAYLVKLIMDAPGSVWPSAWADASAVPSEMARMLAPYGAGPRKLRVSPGSSPVQGYFRSDLFPRDVPAVPAVPPVGAAGTEVAA